MPRRSHPGGNKIAKRLTVEILENELPLIEPAATRRGMALERFLVECAMVTGVEDVLYRVGSAITEDQQVAAEEVLS